MVVIVFVVMVINVNKIFQVINNKNKNNNGNKSLFVGWFGFNINNNWCITLNFNLV